MLAVLAAVSWAVLGAVIRVIWKLSERVSRLEGVISPEHSQKGQRGER